MRVYLERDRERLRIRVVYQGKKYQFSTGLTDTPTHRAYADGVVSKIRLDMLSGQFDTSLLKYRPQAVGSNPVGVSCPELFQRFIKHKVKDCGLSNRSVETRYKPLLKYLSEFLDYDAQKVGEQQAKNFKSILLEKVTVKTARERLWLLQSCWEWATGKHLPAGKNPWNGLTSGIKVAPSEKVKPFTAGEIAAILRAFRSHRYYAHYSDYVSFLFNVATRPGEAAGLRWNAVSSDFTTIWIGKSYSRGYFGATKNNKDRIVILNAATSEMLRKRFEALSPQPDDWVFMTKRGLPICDRNFRNRAWATILAECHIPYRKSYTTRKSAISHALKNKANYLEVAESAGHDPKVMHDRYADVIQSQSVFVEF
jgi:integrase